MIYKNRSAGINENSGTPIFKVAIGAYSISLR